MGRRKINYNEGTVFWVPCREGGYARGVVCRLDGKGGVLGCFFAPLIDDVVDLPSSLHLNVDQAVFWGRFGDLGLINGEWLIIGQIVDWCRDDWPMPLFLNKSDCGLYQSVYSDRLELISIEKVKDANRLPKLVCDDGAMGYGYVEITLSEILGGASTQREGGNT